MLCALVYNILTSCVGRWRPARERGRQCGTGLLALHQAQLPLLFIVVKRYRR